jgi:hypothetical protein
MKNTTTIVAVAMAALSFAAATAVFAHESPGMGMQPGMGPGMMGMGPGMGMGMGPMAGMHGPMGPRGRMAGGDPTANMDAQLATLKAELEITPGQDAAWQAFTGKARIQAQTMQALRGKAQEATGPAPERMAQRTEFMKLRLANMEAMSGAVKDLYAVLSPKQKALADQHIGAMNGAHRHGPAFGPGRRG